MHEVHSPPQAGRPSNLGHPACAPRDLHARPSPHTRETAQCSEFMDLGSQHDLELNRRWQATVDAAQCAAMQPN
eukprot:2209571-Alexandrium_andersonii.AAC.1